MCGFECEILIPYSAIKNLNFVLMEYELKFTGEPWIDPFYFLETKEKH